MPCRRFPFWRRRSADEMTALSASTSSPAVRDWFKVRRYYLRRLRKQTRMVLLLMALIEALKIGPAELVYAGRDGYSAPGKEDYGITHTVAYVLSYIYVCVFMLFFVPLFSWWVPASTPCDPAHPSLGMRIVKYLQKFNMITLPLCAAHAGVSYLVYLVHLFIYVDNQPIGSRKLPKNTKKNWMARLLLLCGVALSVSLGYGALQIWAAMDLAHVKTLEYAVVIVPIQINIGLMFGSRMQMKMEKRIAMKEAARKEVKGQEDLLAVDEKTGLIEV